MVAIHIPREADEWPHEPQLPERTLRPVPGTGRQRRPAPAAPRRRLPDRATRIRRRRLAALAAVVLVVVLGVVAVRAIAGLVSVGATSAPEPVQLGDRGPAPAVGDDYVVRPGDTLWSIATQIAPDDDPRAVVDALREANGSAELQVGDRLVLDVG